MRRRGNEIRFWRGVGIVLLSFAIILTGSIGPWFGNVQAASSWNAHTSGTTKDINNIAYGNGRWVGVANQGQIITSTDGASWSMKAIAISPLGVLYAGNRWIMVGYAGKMYTSVDGDTWIQKTTNVSADLSSIAYNGSIYVVVGANGTILTSNDADTWTVKKQGTDSLNAVTYGGGKFVAIGSGGVIYTSFDGGSWVKVSSGVTTQLFGLTYANSRYIVVGENGTLLTSMDGTTWTQQASPVGTSFYGVAYGGNKFIAVGDSIISSSDGVNWVPEDPGSPHYFNHIAFGDGRFIAGGENGRLISQLVPKSSNANLSNLTLSAGTLSPVFASGTLSYTANVANAVTELDVTPTVTDSKASVKVNGATVASGSASRVALNVGANTITVVVTAEDGTPKTYTVTVTRAVPKSSNADLNSLALSVGTLSPTFASGQTSYTANVASGVTELNVTPTVADSKATVTVNGATVASGSASRVSLNVGPNPIAVVVTAEDGTTKTYTVTVTRAQSSNADLSSLTLSEGTLSPAFATGTTSYTASVANNVASLDATATVADSKATVTINGASVASGSVTRVSLNVGSNPITVVVTAEDGTPKTYTVTVTRAKSSNADLSSLMLSAGTLSPAFASGTTSYTANVASGVTELDLTLTVAESKATVTVNGTAAVSGSATRVSLNVGSNPITVVVTAEDGTPKTYTVTVTRAKSSNADLSSLMLSAGTLSPAFASGTTSYTANVASGVTELDLTLTVAESKATVTVNGTAAVSGSATRVSLNVGSNPITVVVTAEDGTPKTYTVTVTRAVPKSSNADLGSLTLSAGTLSPAFASGTTSYTANVASSVMELDLTPMVADSKATVTVNGTAVASGSATRVSLNVGANPITVVVTAEDGTPKTYTVTVTRAVPKSSNADLGSLTLSAGTLSPAFASGTTSYTANVASGVTELDVTPTVADSKASVTVNGVAVASGSASRVPLNVGPNPITVVVTAEDGTPKTYTVTVTRATPPQSSNANLSNLTLSAGTLSPAFASGTASYTASVTNAVYDVDVSAIASDAAATLTINGTAAANGTTVKVPLNIGANAISILVTAQNGTTKTYTVIVTRSTPPQSSNADLSSLTLSAGTLSPTFSSGNTNYTATVTNAVYEVNISAIAADASSTIMINGTAAANGTAVKATLKVGANPIAILVTAQDGSSKLYSVTLTREAPASNGGSNGSGDYTPKDSKGSIQVIDANGSIHQVPVGHLIDANLLLSADIYDSTSNKQLQQNIMIASDGTFTFKPLSKGTYRVHLFVTAINGQRLAGTEGELVVHSSDKAVMRVTAIDPFSVIRDAATKQPISGAKVSVYWADTELNKQKGRVSGTQVVLPRIEAKKLSVNENVQYSDTEGRFGWLLFPEGDYYVIAEKEGFKTYDSRKEQSATAIHVKHTALKLDIRMVNETKEHAPYIRGYKDGTFRPNQGITRAELASILARLFLQAEQSKKQTIAFTDVEASHWANKHIAAVAQSKLMIGDKHGRFQPDQTVTRAEIAIIASKLKQLKTSEAQSSDFTDVKGHWAEAYIQTASETNLLKGFPDGTYRPQQSLTRAQVVVLINKILGRTPASIDAMPKWKDVQPTYWAYDEIMEASTAHRYLLKEGQEVWLKQ